MRAEIGSRTSPRQLLIPGAHDASPRWPTCANDAPGRGAPIDRQPGARSPAVRTGPTRNETTSFPCGECVRPLSTRPSSRKLLPRVASDAALFLHRHPSGTRRDRGSFGNLPELHGTDLEFHRSDLGFHRTDRDKSFCVNMMSGILYGHRSAVPPLCGGLQTIGDRPANFN